MDYSYKYQTTGQSAYQSRETTSIHRIRLQYAHSENIYLRALINLKYQEEADEIEEIEDVQTGILGLENEEPLLNLTGSWEYQKGSFLHFVYNRAIKKSGFTNLILKEDFSSFILKITMLL